MVVEEDTVKIASRSKESVLDHMLDIREYHPTPYTLNLKP